MIPEGLDKELKSFQSGLTKKLTAAEKEIPTEVDPKIKKSLSKSLKEASASIKKLSAKDGTTKIEKDLNKTSFAIEAAISTTKAASKNKETRGFFSDSKVLDKLLSARKEGEDFERRLSGLAQEASGSMTEQTKLALKGMNAKYSDAMAYYVDAVRPREHHAFLRKHAEGVDKRILKGERMLSDAMKLVLRFEAEGKVPPDVVKLIRAQAGPLKGLIGDVRDVQQTLKSAAPVDDERKTLKSMQTSYANLSKSLSSLEKAVTKFSP